MARFSVSLGEEFAVEGVEVEDVADVQALAEIDGGRRLARHQVGLTYSVLAAFVIALSVAGFLGWADGSYDEIDAVWSAGGFWVGIVLGRYFKKD